jgi:CBS-domain-containing membrane protein
MRLRWHDVRGWLGVEAITVSRTEKLVSLVGGFAGILGIMSVSWYALGVHTGVPVIASMGASAVLLFAVPHGPLSQPWPLIGGHLVSAVIGVSCAQFVPVDILAAPLAVGLAIGVMYYLRCIHPPGGATALVAVIGGQEIVELGYRFVLLPVALNVIVILAVAILFNYVFAWRRYPVYVVQQRGKGIETKHAYEVIAHADLVYALSQIDSFIDVSESDLLRIYELATKRRHPQRYD